MSFYDTIQFPRSEDTTILIEGYSENRVNAWVLCENQLVIRKSLSEFPIQCDEPSPERFGGTCHLCGKEHTKTTEVKNGGFLMDLPDLISEELNFTVRIKDKLRSGYLCDMCIDEYNSAVNQLSQRNKEQILTTEV